MFWKLVEKNHEETSKFIYLASYSKFKIPLLNLYSRDKQSNRGGDVYLGAIEPRHIYGKNLSAINYLPVTSYAFWQFDIDRCVF